MNNSNFSKAYVMFTCSQYNFQVTMYKYKCTCMQFK